MDLAPDSRSGRVLALLRSGTPSLLAVLEHIAREPHHGVWQESPVVALEEAADPDVERLVELVDDPRAIAPAPDDPVHFEVDDMPCRFAELPDRRVVIGVDTYPNRFVRHFIVRCVRLLADLSTEDRRIRGRLAALVTTGPLAAVSPLSVVSFDDNSLRKDPRYVRVLAAHVALGSR